MSQKETQQQADKVVTDYALKKLGKAFERVETERHGAGCGCIQCASGAVKEVNGWVNWTS